MYLIYLLILRLRESRFKLCRPFVCLCGCAWRFAEQGTRIAGAADQSCSPKLEYPVPDCVVVEGIWGRHCVRDVELFPICHFLWWTLHPGHFQTCENTHAPPEHTHSNCSCKRAHSWAPHTSFWTTKEGEKRRVCSKCSHNLKNERGSSPPQLIIL